MHYVGRAQLQSIASRFQHLAIDETTRSIAVEATHDELVALRRDGIDATIDDAATRRLRQAQAVAGTPVVVKDTIRDARFSTRNGIEAVQPIRSAAAFLDQEPWAPVPRRARWWPATAASTSPANPPS
jgi:hypothetical protein